MRYLIDHDLHLHSMLSSCSSDPEQTAEAILRYAEGNGLRQICLTDHYWDTAVPGASDWYKPQNYEHIASALPLPTSQSCQFLFGCETDMDRHGTIGIPKERYGDFDFIIVPTTHLHMKGFTYLPKDETVERKRELFIRRFESFLSADLPFHKIGLAHITCKLIFREEDQYLRVLDSISDETYERLFDGCKEVGCGVELNMGLSEITDPVISRTVLRPYLIAKERGCRFYLGSDAHHPKNLAAAMARMEAAVNALGLTEVDKFRPAVRLPFAKSHLDKTRFL